MKLRILTLLIFIATTSFADDATITIRQKSGNETILELATHPVITFESENMVIKNDFTQIFVPLADIDTYTVSNGTTGIKSASIDSEFSNGHVKLNGIPIGTAIYVYSIDGKIVSKLSANDEGKADISLETLPKGAFVISALNHTIKIINK